MKKTPLLNSRLSAVIARMGHTQTLTIGDCGLPVQGHAERIDLALCKGTPAFLEVLETVLSELYIERALMAEEIKTISPEMHEQIKKLLPKDVRLDYVAHEELKRLSENSEAIVRTGECTSYANIVLQSGVTF